jgi:hypothetical protein
MASHDMTLTLRVDEPSDDTIQAALIAQFFAWQHLPAHLRPVSRRFAVDAAWIILNVPRNPERTVALRKLLECKDATVRAVLARTE